MCVLACASAPASSLRASCDCSPLDPLDGVPGGAHARHLVAVAVRHPRVGHRVAVVAVRIHLHHHRPVLDH
eukprot:5420693-Pleurochrysis_carterae.AAC.1